MRVEHALKTAGYAREMDAMGALHAPMNERQYASKPPDIQASFYKWEYFIYYDCTVGYTGVQTAKKDGNLVFHTPKALPLNPRPRIALWYILKDPG
jgi:hypothetical protein